MRVALADRDRRSLLFIGPLTFTYDDPGPKEIDLRNFSKDQIDQIVYNWRQGVLIVDDEDELKSWAEASTPTAKGYSTPAGPVPQIDPARPTAKSPVEAQEEAAKQLKKLLSGRIPTIRAALPGLRMAELRKLLELEKSRKARKKVITMLEEVIASHENEVLASVGTQDLSQMAGIHSQDGVVAKSTQLSDIVESEVEQIVLNPILED